MGGGGGSQKSTSTVYQSSLPQYAEPYYKSLMQRGQAESTRPYQPYRGQRLAGMSGDTSTGLGMAGEFAGSSLDHISNGISNVGGIAQQATGYADFDPGEFDEAARQKYMSPYMQDVIDKARKDNALATLEEQTYRNSAAAKAGAFGGSRAAVQNQMALNAMQDRNVDISVEGHQAAFENAQQQFERDRQARFGAAQLGLEGLGLGLQGNELMTQMQGQMDNMSLNRIKAQLGIGQTKEDYQQERLDMAYDDFINQRDAQRQNLQFMSSLLQGVPISANQNVVTNQPTNPVAGAAGSLMGLQALYALGRS